MLRILTLLLLALGVAATVTAQNAPPPAGSAAPPVSAAPANSYSATVPVAGTSAAPPVSAAPANSYSATVPVAGTSDAQRDAAIAAALTQVLQQVSPGFAASPDVLAQAPGYVRNFHYGRAPSGAGLELQVEFDPGAVGRLVAQTQAGAGAAAAAATPAPGASGAPPATAQGGSGTLWIAGIHDSHAFASLLSLLRGDPDLHDVTPVGAEGDGVLLQLRFDQPLATVIANLSGPAGHLAPDPAPQAGADASAQWVP